MLLGWIYRFGRLKKRTRKSNNKIRALVKIPGRCVTLKRLQVTLIFRNIRNQKFTPSQAIKPSGIIYLPEKEVGGHKRRERSRFKSALYSKYRYCLWNCLLTLHFISLMLWQRFTSFVRNKSLCDRYSYSHDANFRHRDKRDRYGDNLLDELGFEMGLVCFSKERTKGRDLVLLGIK